jgi:hypothetical protein
MVGAFTVDANAQASGTKPELIMYRHNSSINNSPTVVIPDNILGTVKWNGLTAIGAVRTGASIRSVTKFVGPGMISANMIFSTSNVAALNDRMIITETGLVGIGTSDPDYHLHVVGNTHTSGDFFGRIHFDALVGDNSAPNTYIDEAAFERKNRAVLGVPTAAGIHPTGGTLSLAPGGGSYDHQLFFGQDGIWNRRETGDAGAWSGTWEKLLSNNDVKGTPNRIARFLPPDNPSSKIGDSQIFDDGTDVGIGTVTPDAAYLLTVGGDTRINGALVADNNLHAGANLQVSGNALINGNAAASNLTASNNTQTQSLNVANNSQTGSLTVQTDALVQQNCRVNGRLVVGNPAATPGNHELYINGSAIAEEIVVKLQGNWPDYVFEKQYELPSLPSVAQYIDTHKHLPGVASAREIEANGQSVGALQKVQMEKIEELFLHVIALEKRIQTLETENAALKSARQ